MSHQDQTSILRSSGDPFVVRFWCDARYAVRRLAQSPGFTLTAILSLALGIGANTAIFSVVNAVLIRKPPLERPGELVDIYSSRPDFAYGAFCYPDFEAIREGTREVFAELAAIRLAPVHADREDVIETLFAELVSGTYCSWAARSPRKTTWPREPIPWPFSDTATGSASSEPTEMYWESRSG